MAPANTGISSSGGAVMSDVSRIELTITNLACAGAAALLEVRIQRLRGVLGAAINPVTERMVVTYDPNRTSPGDLRTALQRDLGVEVSAWVTGASPDGPRGRIVLQGDPERTRPPRRIP